MLYFYVVMKISTASEIRILKMYKKDEWNSCCNLWVTEKFDVYRYFVISMHCDK